MRNRFVDLKSMPNSASSLTAGLKLYQLTIVGKKSNLIVIGLARFSEISKGESSNL